MHHRNTMNRGDQYPAAAINIGLKSVAESQIHPSYILPLLDRH